MLRAYRKQNVWGFNSFASGCFFYKGLCIKKKDEQFNLNKFPIYCHLQFFAAHFLRVCFSFVPSFLGVI
jgi:hypothetical protein